MLKDEYEVDDLPEPLITSCDLENEFEEVGLWAFVKMYAWLRTLGLEILDADRHGTGPNTSGG